jgi:predicted DNA-binding transcriptional regulator YafY
MRLLTILELLQSRSEVSGQELAQKLEVEERSIRRYIMMLRDMGIPIEGERGRHGGYALQKGFRLPPLMFNKDEITAVMLCLMLARELSVTSLPAIESATAKIERVLPEELQQSADALRDSLILDNVQIGASAVSNEWIATLSRAAYEGKCLQIRYASGDGTLTDRMIAPYGLVLHARTWYVAAYCYLRKDMRVFRLDRVRSISPTAQSFTKPDDFDTKSFILGSILKGSGNYTFEVLFDAPLSTVKEIIPQTMAILEEVGRKTLMRCYSDDPYWLARYLVRIELPFTVLQSDELRDALQTLANDILATIQH